MRRISKLLLGLAAVALVALPVSQSLAGVQNIQGGMFNVGTAPSTDPFASRCAQERIWAVIGTNPNPPINPSNCPTTGVGICGTLGRDTTTQACNRGWLSSAGNSGFPGYFSHVEQMNQFDATADNYPVYILWENVKNPGTNNGTSYYYLAGQFANNAPVTDKGRFQDPTCAGTVTVSCFLPGTSGRNGGSRSNTRAHLIANEGGLSPIPVPKITGIAAGVVSLTWDPVVYFDNGDGAANPFKTYRLYRALDTNNNGVCDIPADTDPAWLPLKDVAGTSTTDTLPAYTNQDCAVYALRLVFNLSSVTATGSGPGAALGELTTGNLSGASGLSFGSQGAKINPLASTFGNFDVKYAGKNTMRVSWTSGVESGISAYRVARATSQTGPFAVVSGDIAAKGDNQIYSYLDKVSRSMGTTFWYQLIVVHTDGSTDTLSPASASLPNKSGK